MGPAAAGPGPGARYLPPGRFVGPAPGRMPGQGFDRGHGAPGGDAGYAGPGSGKGGPPGSGGGYAVDGAGPQYGSQNASLDHPDHHGGHQGYYQSQSSLDGGSQYHQYPGGAKNSLSPSLSSHSEPPGKRPQSPSPSVSSEKTEQELQVNFYFIFFTL